MYKRILSLLLALVLVVGALPVSGFVMSAAATEGTTNDDTSSTIPGAIATDTTTKGAWQGKYGNDVALLFGYKYNFTDYLGETSRITKAYVDQHLLVVGEADYYNKITPVCGGTLWSWVPAENSESLLDMPAVTGASPTVISNYAMNGYTKPTHTHFNGDTSWMPDNTSYGYVQIDLNDTEKHILTIYSDYDKKYGQYSADNIVTFYIIDELSADANVLAKQSYTASDFSGGRYVSFEISGDCCLVYSTANTAGNVFGISALFFDSQLNNSPESNELTTPTAVQVGTGVSLTWTNSGTESVTVERSVSGSDTWETLTTVAYDAAANGSYSYTDTTAVGGTTYSYRVKTTTETSESVTVEVLAAAAELVGMVAGLGGDWIGKVGAEGYFLPFYTIYGAWGEIASGRYTTSSDGCTGYSLQEASSIINFPDSITPATVSPEFGTHNGYSIDSTHFKTTTDTRALEDPREGYADTRIKSYVSGGAHTAGTGYALTNTDSTTWYYVTVYATCYDKTVANGETIQIQNSEGTVLAEKSVTQAELKSGVYVTFKVRGSFKVRAVATSDYAYLTGIFFDTVPTETQLSGFAAQQSGTDVNLTWTYTGTNSVEVQRKASNEETWTTLDTVAASANAYTDATVQAGSTYEYRVGVVNPILGTQTTDAVSVTVNAPTAEVVGMVTGLGGDWIGKVGAEGYFLPFYTIYGAYGDISSGRYDTTTTECTGWSLQEDSSIIEFPSWISATMSTDELNTHNGYSVDSTHFKATADTRAPQDPREGATTRIKSYVKGGSYIGYHFTNSDATTWRYVTVYATGYDNGVAETIQILDYKGSTVIAEQTVTAEEMKAGVYVTFKVKGSFTLKAVVSSSYAYFNGIFFDNVPAWEASDFSATLEEGSRTPTLTWTNHATATQVVIERKDSVTDTWTQIAVTEAGTTSYTDNTCEVNKTYTYRIAPTNSILCGSYSAEQSVDMPSYQETELVMGDQDGYTANVKEAVTVSGTLKTAAGTALAGKTVTITLAGELVDKGFVQAVQGTATTGTDGSFTYTLNNLPAGTYALTASFAVEDEDLLAQSSADAQITIEVPGWSGAPVLTTVSDGVAPGDYFSINGYGMSGDLVIAKIGAVGSAVANATTLTIAQHDATDGYFVQALMPAGMAGTYQVWVSNDNGTTWSDPILLNAARPLFISEDTAWNGLTIDISGRNLLGSQYGASDATAVRLVPVNGGDAIAQTVKECNPYRIAFEVTGATAGVAYHVEATNDGTNWARITSGQTLTVKAVGKDPLGLGVAWAGEFNWDNRFVVTDAAYGATNNDATDDTAAIQAAVDAAAAQANGGVVYLPAGDYYVSSIKVPAHVVIEGESKETTILHYIGTNGVNMFDSHGTGETDGWHGFARFTIRLTDNSSQPRTYFNLGHEWTNQTIKNVSARTSGHIFLSEVDIDTDVFADGGSPRGNAIVPVIGEHFLMHDCHFVGYRATIASGQIGAYASIRDSYMEIVGDFPQCNANYTFIVNLDLYVHYETAEVSHGITVRGSAHIEDCYVFGTGGRLDSGDGEALLAEATTYYDYGRVVSVDGTKIQLDGEKGTLSNFEWRYGKVAIMIIDGTGIGQYRIVDLEKSGFVWDNSKGTWTNTDTSELVVTEEWTVEPDATSMYSLELIMEDVTFCENLIDDCSNAMMFYGNVVDGVIAGNDSVDSKGIWIYSSHVKGNGRVTTAYRISVRDNDIIGVSRTTDRGGIYVHTQRSGVGGEYVAVFVYGLDIKDNRIYGDPSIVPEGLAGGTPPYNGIVIAANTVSSDDNCKMALGQGDVTNLIIQNNVLKHLNDGIYYTNCTYGTLLAGNYFEDVANKWYEIRTKGNDSDFLLLKNIGDATAAPACDDHDCNDWDTTVAPAAGTCVWCSTAYSETVREATVENFSVTLGDSIDLDFYLKLSADVLADQNAYVKVTLPDMSGTTYNVKVSELTKTDDGLVLVPCATAAKEMTGIVRLQVFSGDWNSPSIERTVQDYAKKLIALAALDEENGTTYSKAVPAVKAMLNYGTAAQLHFGYNTQNLANSILAEEEQTITSLDAEEMVTALSPYGQLTTTGSADGITFVGATLMLEGKTGLRLYFDVEDGSQINAVLSVPEGVTGVTLKDYTAKSGSSYTGYVEIQGIAAKHLGESFTVTVNDTLVIQHSPMKYGYNVQKGTYDESLDNLVSSLYTYYAAANAYFAE